MAASRADPPCPGYLQAWGMKSFARPSAWASGMSAITIPSGQGVAWTPAIAGHPPRETGLSIGAGLGYVEGRGLWLRPDPGACMRAQIDFQTYRNCPVADELGFLEACAIDVASPKFPIPVQPAQDFPALMRVIQVLAHILQSCSHLNQP